MRVYSVISLPDSTTKKYFRDNSIILTGEVKYKSIRFFTWQSSHFSIMFLTNSNLLNKRDNAKEVDPQIFHRMIVLKNSEISQITSKVEEACKFSEKRL